jgi:radical SAM protein with 4Fe4S-binding SPASM domain
MDYDLFKRIVDECAELGVKVVRPQYMGEPLIDVRFPEMLRYINSKGLYSHISTTGFLLTEQLSEDIIESGVNVITFSFHGTDRETYQYIHGVDGYDRCVSNIETFYKIRDKLVSSTPEIVFQFMKTNKADTPPIIMNGFVDRTKITNCSYNSYFDTFDLSVNNKHNSMRDAPCFQVISRIAVLVDGTVTICCNDANGDLAIGNIYDSSIKELFKNEKVKQYRKQHLEGEYPNICKYCSSV